jgi:hypothetical protein
MAPRNDDDFFWERTFLIAITFLYSWMHADRRSGFSLPPFALMQKVEPKNQVYSICYSLNARIFPLTNRLFLHVFILALSETHWRFTRRFPGAVVYSPE